MSEETSGTPDYLTVKLPRRAHQILSELKYLQSSRTGEPVYNTVLITELLEKELEKERGKSPQTV